MRNVYLLILSMPRAGRLAAQHALLVAHHQRALSERQRGEVDQLQVVVHRRAGLLLLDLPEQPLQRGVLAHRALDRLALGGARGAHQPRGVQQLGALRHAALHEAGGCRGLAVLEQLLDHRGELRGGGGFHREEREELVENGRGRAARGEDEVPLQPEAVEVLVVVRQQRGARVGGGGRVAGVVELVVEVFDLVEVGARSGRIGVGSCIAMIKPTSSKN